MPTLYSGTIRVATALSSIWGSVHQILPNALARVEVAARIQPGSNGTSWSMALVHVNGQGFLWQVNPEGADDMETEWDPYGNSTTYTGGFAAGVAAEESLYPSNLHTWLIDYGTADMGDGGCGTWTAEDIYFVAWSWGWDIPLPEAYFQSNCYSSVNAWIAVEQDYTSMEFWGAMAECAGGDPLPGGPSSRCNSDSEFTRILAWLPSPAIWTPPTTGKQTSKTVLRR